MDNDKDKKEEEQKKEENKSVVLKVQDSVLGGGKLPSQNGGK